MAKIQFGSVVNDARNKTGGIVYSKNKNGSFIRRKVSPSQPHTSSQAAIRGGLTVTSKDWSNVLTGPQRSAWAAFATLHPVTDQFGASSVLTGHQMYVRVNNALMFAGQPTITDPPLTFTAPAVTLITAAAAAGAATFNITALTPNPAPTATQYQIYVTKQLPAGRASLATFYRFLLPLTFNVALPVLLINAYSARFGALTAGKVIGLGIRIIDMTTGAQSPMFTTIVQVAP